MPKKLFKKGTSGNPSGRPKLTEEDKIVQKMTRETWNDLCQKMMTCTKDELEEIIASECPMEVETFIRHMLKINEDPDWHAYEKYLARRIGPVKQEVDLNLYPKPTVIKRADGTTVLGAADEEDEK